MGQYVPEGSYKQTSKNIRVTLSADCKKNDGTYNPDTLDITDLDNANIENRNGRLVNDVKEVIRFSMCDMLKIGIGSSSSHTLAPWQSAKECYADYIGKFRAQDLKSIHVELFGSLAFVGRGHYTTVALPLGLLQKEVFSFNVSQELEKTLGIDSVTKIGNVDKLKFDNGHEVDYSISFNTVKDKDKEKMVFTFTDVNDKSESFTYYSYGGGSFGTDLEPGPLYEGLEDLTYEYKDAGRLLALIEKRGTGLREAVWQNECDFAAYRKRIDPDYKIYPKEQPRDEKDIAHYLKRIARQMGKLIYHGCITDRKKDECYKIMYAEPKAKAMFDDLMGAHWIEKHKVSDWISFVNALRQEAGKLNFDQVLKLIGAFGLAVGEQNAALKNVVTAPTNGACGGVPAVLYYYIIFHAGDAEREWLVGEEKEEPVKGNKIIDLLLTVSTVGGIIKANANIAGGIGGCQAEIGTASAMAAGAVTNVLGGKAHTVFQAAEAALEAHLGSTCDPIGGLVEIPCIVRNMTAATTAMAVTQEVLSLYNGQTAIIPRVSFDEAVETMQNISENLPDIYKETSKGGLAKVKHDQIRAERPDLFGDMKTLEEIKVVSPFRSTC